MPGISDARWARQVNAQRGFCITPRQHGGKRGSQRNGRVVVSGDHQARPALAVTRDDEGVFMKGSWTALAVALSAIFAAIGCNDYGNTFQVPTGATITSISPSCTVAGGAAFTLTVTGTNFVMNADPTQGSQVLWGAGGTQTTLATVSGGSATQIQATVSSTLIASTGTANVSVFNPPAQQAGSRNGGGGTSQTSLPFTIAATSCPTGAARPAAAVQSVGEENPAVSTDGRFVAFTATQEEHAQIFVRDTCQGATAACQARTLLISAATDGAAGNDGSRSPSMSTDGRYIAFSSAATNLLAEAPPGHQIYLRDTCLGARTPCAPSTQLVSTDAQGALVGTEAILPSVSASGRFVTFVAITSSHADAKSATSTKDSANILSSGFRQVFVRDTCLAATNCTPVTLRITSQPGDSPATD